MMLFKFHMLYQFYNGQELQINSSTCLFEVTWLNPQRAAAAGLSMYITQ